MNPYDVLGVSKDASEGDIKKAYRKMAHKHHPDKAGGDEEKFKEVNAAYQILSNPEKKTQYDQFGQTFDGAGRSGGGFGHGGTGASGGQGFEFNFGGGDAGFEDVFSGMFGGGQSRTGAGQDIAMDVEISFAQMVSGVHKELEIYKNTTCDECHGSGGAPDAQESECSECKGAGHIQKHVQTMLGTIAQRVQCSNCQGRGKTFDKNCGKCQGDGRTKETVKIDADIPAGIQSGQQIAFSGQGEAGKYGMPSGDLIVRVFVKEDDRLTREGDHVVSEEHVTIAQAALGDKISVETVEGKVKMKVPAGTQSGDVYRIRDKGVPHVRGYGRGDHLVTVTVDIPTKPTKAQKKLFEQLRDLDA